MTPPLGSSGEADTFMPQGHRELWGHPKERSGEGFVGEVAPNTASSAIHAFLRPVPA